MDLQKEVILRGIKMIDIAYMAAIYVTITITFSVIYDKYFVGPVDKATEAKKPTHQALLEIWGHIAVISIAAYIIRNVVEMIPFPLDGVSGFVHKRVKEVGGGVIYGFLLFFYSVHLRQKIGQFIERFF